VAILTDHLFRRGELWIGLEVCSKYVCTSSTNGLADSRPAREAQTRRIAMGEIARFGSSRMGLRADPLDMGQDSARTPHDNFVMDRLISPF
jgi:hypothetical protein